MLCFGGWQNSKIKFLTSIWFVGRMAIGEEDWEPGVLGRKFFSSNMVPFEYSWHRSLGMRT